MTNQNQDMEQRANANITDTTHSDFSTPSSDSRNKRQLDDTDLNDSAYETSTQSSTRSSTSPVLSPAKINTSTHKKTRFDSQAGSSRSNSFNRSSEETASPPKSLQEQADNILDEFDEEDSDGSLALQIIEYLAILWFNKNKNTSSSPVIVTKRMIQHCLHNEKVDPAISLLKKKNLITCDLKKRPVVIEMSSLSKQIWHYWSIQVMKNENQLEQILNHVLSYGSQSKLKDLNTSRGSALSFKGLLKLVVNLASTLDKEKDRKVIGLKKTIGCFLKSSDKEIDTALEVLKSCFEALVEVYDDEKEDDEEEDAQVELKLEITLVQREIAGLHKRRGEFEEAFKVYKQVCSAIKANYGDESEESKSVYLEYHDVLIELKKMDEALVIYKEYGKYMNDKRHYSYKSFSQGESKWKKEEKK